MTISLLKISTGCISFFVGEPGTTSFYISGFLVFINDRASYMYDMSLLTHDIQLQRHFSFPFQ